MNRRVGWIAMTCGFIACGGIVDGPPDRIVFIVVDTLRRDHLSPYDPNVATPNVERIARSGRVYDNAYASFHMTSMSMGAIFSGRTPAISSGDPGRSIAWNASNWCGLARFGGTGGGACIPADMRTLGEEVRDLGYTTIGVTSNAILFSPSGFARGFDQWLEVPDPQREGKYAARARSWQESSERRAAAAVNAAVDTALKRRSSDHFFLYVHYMDVHDWAAVKVPYQQAVEAVDRGIGVLLDRLESEGLLEDAVVVLTSDHGESLDEVHLVKTTPRHIGNPSFEPVLAVPLIVSGAGLPDDGPLIRSEDLHRILVRLAGGEPAAKSELDPDELFVTEISYRTYRRGRWKSFFGRFDQKFRLVVLDRDREERSDVAARHPEVVAAHRARIDELTAVLAAPNAPLHEIDTENLDRLRSLGYVE